MSGKRKKDPHDKAADELLNRDDGNEPDEGGEPDEPEIEVAPRDGDDLPVDQPSRRERRQDRFRERVLQDVEERIGARLSTLDQRLQQLSQQPQRQEPQQPGPDQLAQQIDARLQGIYEQQDAVSATFRSKQKDGTLTDSEYTEMVKRTRKLNEDAQELVTARAARRFGLGRQADPEEAARRAIILQTREKHADVYGHPEANAMVSYADGYFQQRMARAARMGQAVNGPELLEESLDKAREEWGVQPKNRRRERPEAERRKFTAAPSSGGGAGGEGRTVKLTRDVRALADAAFPHIKDDAKRYAHWAKTAGKRIVNGGDE